MNKERRKFVKIILIGSASFMVGKILGPVFSKLIDSAPSRPVQVPQLSAASSKSPKLLSIDSVKPPRGRPSSIFTDRRLSTPRPAKATSFKVVEDGKNFSVYDASGEEVFQIDKGA